MNKNDIYWRLFKLLMTGMNTKAVPMNNEVRVIPSIRSAWVKITKQMSAHKSTMLVI